MATDELVRFVFIRLILHFLWNPLGYGTLQEADEETIKFYLAFVFIHCISSKFETEALYRLCKIEKAKPTPDEVHHHTPSKPMKPNQTGRVNPSVPTNTL